MKRGMSNKIVITFLVLITISLLSVNFISASIVGDFLNNILGGKITGNVISTEGFDSSIDSTKWVQISSTRTATIQNGKLKGVGAAGDISNSDSGVTSSGKWKLQGNFDIQVDYDASIMPSTIGKTSSFAAVAGILLSGSSKNYLLSIQKLQNNNYQYLVWSDQPGVYRSDAGFIIGKLRIVRTGSTIKEYIWSGSGWTEYYTINNVDTSDMIIGLKTYNNVIGSGQGVIPQTYFDNFIINSGNVINTPVCAITDIYSQQVPGYVYSNVYIKASNLPSGNSYSIFGAGSYDSVVFNVITRNSDGSAILQGSQTFNSVAANYILNRKSNITLVDSSKNLICSPITASVSCTDSDNGKDYAIKGNTKTLSGGVLISGKDYTDYCTDQGVMEGFCQNNEGVVEYHQCPNGCLDGVCLNSVTPPTPTTCTDSDNGLNYYVKGTARTGNDTNWKAWSDCCTQIPTSGSACTNTGSYIWEASCNNSQIVRNSYLCPNGCYNGACLNQTPVCTESDGGNNIYVKGTVAFLNSGGTDCCTQTYGGTCNVINNTGNYIWEHTCSNESKIENRIQSYNYECPNGCKDGACLGETTPTTCTDSDNGLNYYVKASIRDINSIEKGWEGSETIVLSSKEAELIINGKTIIINTNSDSKYDTEFGKFEINKINFVSLGNSQNYVELTWKEIYDTCETNTKLIERYCNINNPNAYEEYTCPNGCKDGACVYQQISPICNDSDGGNNRYTAGQSCNQDGCKTEFCTKNSYNETHLTEYACSESGDINTFDIYCFNGCNINGSCAPTIPVQNSVCQNLINLVANPSGFRVYDYQPNYEASDWTSNYSGLMWINNQDERYNEYSASWNAYNSQVDNNENAYVNARIIVFNNHDINLTDYIKERTNYNLCRIDNYWDSNNKQNMVYICSYDVLRGRQDLDNYDYKSRQVFWVNKNVITELQISSGRSLTDEEVSRLANKRVNDLLNDLKDNQAEFVSYQNFDINYLARSFIDIALKYCDSRLMMPNRNGTNETCFPSWSCKLEPVICPEYGYQKRTCTDIGCNNEKREEQVYCSPGLCSGCYVPRWFEKDNSNIDNICMPYGARFEQDTGNILKQLVERTEEDTLIDSNNNNNGYSLDVLSNEKAIFTIYGKTENYTYTLTPGSKVEIKIPDREDGSDIVVVYVKKIVYSSTVGAKNYVDITVYIKGYERTNEKLPMYCNYDGTVGKQKTKESNGNWAKCQNNFECESNLCSGGECLDVQGAIKQSGQFKELFFSLYCRIMNLFNNKGYEKCIADLI